MKCGETRQLSEEQISIVLKQKFSISTPQIYVFESHNQATPTEEIKLRFEGQGLHLQLLCVLQIDHGESVEAPLDTLIEGERDRAACSFDDGRRFFD